MIAILKLLISLQTVTADLPIHATIDQITNEWEFTLVPISQSGFTSKEEQLPENYIPACGSSLPNSNDDNLQADLQLNYVEWAKAAQLSFTKRPFAEALRVNLTAERHPMTGQDGSSHRREWQGLGVYRGDEVVGRWTMIYDEAFEVVLDQGNLKLTALLKYSMKPGHPSCLASVEASEDRHGQNRCYITDPDETLLGWFETAEADTAAENKAKRIYGCLQGRQVGSSLSTTNFDMMRKIVKLKSRKPVRQHYSSAQLQHSSGAERLGVSESSHMQSSGFGQQFLSPFRPEESILTQVESELGVKYAKCSDPDEEDLSAKVPSEDLSKEIPESFSWGDPFLAPEKMTEHDRTLWQQGECGSCYALASVYALQKRAEILLARRGSFLSNETHSEQQQQRRSDRRTASFLSSGLSAESLLAAALPVRLSPTSLLTCSFYNQGCQGGYPFLVGKWAQQFGITSDNCEGVYSPTSLSQCSLPHSLLSGATDGGTTDAGTTDAGTTDAGTTEPTPAVSEQVFDAVGEQGGDAAPSVPMVFIGTDLADAEESRYHRRSSRSGARPSPPLTLTTKDCAYQARVFAADYGYVGGCFECCSELAMRQEIFRNGPIVVAVDSPPSFISYTNGVFTDHPQQHFARCSPTEANHHLAGWEYTNHAIAIVGFGTIHTQPSHTHYWIGRNSWGNDWGLDGYFLIERGRNLGGIENQAVFIDPDSTRGILKHLIRQS